MLTIFFFNFSNFFLKIRFCYGQNQLFECLKFHFTGFFGSSMIHSLMCNVGTEIMSLVHFNLPLQAIFFLAILVHFQKRTYVAKYQFIISTKHCTIYELVCVLYIIHIIISIILIDVSMYTAYVRRGYQLLKHFQRTSKAL